MPLGLTSYFLLAAAVSHHLSPAVVGKKNTVFFFFSSLFSVAFSFLSRSSASLLECLFFYPLKVKRERIKNKHTPETTRTKRRATYTHKRREWRGRKRIRVGVWTAFTVWVKLFVWMKMAPIPCFFVVCAVHFFFSFFGVTNGFFPPFTQPPALFQTCTKKRHPPQSHPSWRKSTTKKKEGKKRKKLSVMTLVYVSSLESEFPGPVCLGSLYNPMKHIFKKKER